MSKKIKQMEMDALSRTFEGVKNFVFIEPSKVNADLDYNARKDLREKNVRLQMVKNSLARRVLADQGIELDDGIWEGSTLIAWGTDSIKELSKAIDRLLEVANKDAKKTGERYKVKTAVLEGQPLPFAQALKVPTREEAIGEVVAALLGPSSTLAAQLIGPASQVASQIAQIGEKKEGEGE